MAALLSCGGCQRPTKAAADQQVYSLLGVKRGCVPEAAGRLDVDAAERVARLAREEERGVLTLREALTLATQASREYREEREQVFLSALDLTGQRHAFDALPGLGGAAALAMDQDGVEVAAGGQATLSRALKSGGSVALALATDILRNLTGDPLRTAQSILAAELIVPLWRGSGSLVAMENLRQAERNTIYALRSFARFQQDFTVQISDSYFRGLQAWEIWKNEESAFESLQQLVMEQAEKAKAGRIPEFLVDQARQDLLRSDDRRQREYAAYQAALDRLKVELGVAVDRELQLDPAEFTALENLSSGLVAPEPERLAQARQWRLDLKNGRDQEVDAVRKVEVARNALAGQVDLRLGANLNTPGAQPWNLRSLSSGGSLGLDVDLPLDRLDERNTWRAAMLAATQAARNLQRLDDRIVQDVRESARRLDQTARSRQIQAEGVRLAERRVESTALFLEQGDATIRDRLEAEDARRQARNALTTARVDLFLSWLRLQSDMGTLRVDASGSWAPPEPDAAPSGEAPVDAPQGEAPAVASGTVNSDGSAQADAPTDQWPPSEESESR